MNADSWIGRILCEPFANFIEKICRQLLAYAQNFEIALKFI